MLPPPPNFLEEDNKTHSPLPLLSTTFTTLNSISIFVAFVYAATRVHVREQRGDRKFKTAQFRCKKRVDLKRRY